MPTWLERLSEDEEALGHAEVYTEYVKRAFAEMGDVGISRSIERVIQNALFGYFDEVIEYARPRQGRLEVVDALRRLVAVLSQGGRIKQGETLSGAAVDLLIEEAFSGRTARTTSFRQDAAGKLVTTRSPEGLVYAAHGATLFLPDDPHAATAKVDRLSILREDDQVLADRQLPVGLPLHIVGTMNACRQRLTGNIPLVLFRKRLTPAERILLRRVATRTADLAELALGIQDRVGANHRTHTLADYTKRPPLASFGLKLLEAGFRREDDRRLLMTGDGEIDWRRFYRLVDLLVFGFNVANDIRREQPDLRRLNLLVGYQVGRESSGYDEPRDGEQAFEKAMRKENKPTHAARRAFLALVRKYESFFVLKFVNRFLDYYDYRLQEIDRTPIKGAYDLFLNRTFFKLREWERELEAQLKEGALRPYDRFPRIGGEAAVKEPQVTPLVPDEMLSLPMPLAYRSGAGIFAWPERELVEFLIDVRFEREPAKRGACSRSWHQLATFFPPENLQVGPVEFRRGTPVGHR